MSTTNATDESPPRRDRWLLAGLLLQLLVVGCGLALSGRLRAVETNDSAGYINQQWGSLPAVLGGLRTPGYPAFLAVLRTVSSENQLVPTMHVVAYSMSVLFFYLGLKRLGRDSVRAFIGASSLIYTRILIGYVNTVATDTLAAAVGILVCALIMIRLTSPSLKFSLLLSMAVMLGWLVRPAYLYLVPMVPIVTGLMYSASTDSQMSRRWHVSTAILLVVAPLIAYSSLRFAVVGRFGIVSFGGGNILGIAGQFLQRDDIARLPEDLRDIASTALERVESGTLKAGAFDDLPASNYMRMEDRYDLTIWHIFSDAESGEVERDPVAWNSRARRLAFELIKLHPREYVIWLIKATRQAARKIPWDFADNGFGFVLMILGLAAGLAHSSRWNWLSSNRSYGCDTMRIVSLLAIVYMLMNLAVVIPVCPPLGRFTDAATVLLAAPLAIWVWNSIVQWRYFVTGSGSTFRGPREASEGRESSNAVSAAVSGD